MMMDDCSNVCFFIVKETYFFLHQECNPIGVFTKLRVPGFVFRLFGDYQVQKGHLHFCASFSAGRK